MRAKSGRLHTARQRTWRVKAPLTLDQEQGQGEDQVHPAPEGEVRPQAQQAVLRWLAAQISAVPTISFSQ